jgi:predicted dehydrogenase
VKVGIIGCGLIGKKRADALGDDRLAAVFDKNEKAARDLADKSGAEACRTVEELLARVDCVVVATTNDALASLTLQAIESKKHVVVEKPAARSADELLPLLSAARAARVTVKVGFNHRFHPAVQKARAILDGGTSGPIMFVRARYGHGGRIGYDREWRARPEMSGGGELIDQGVHLIDLARWFVGAEFTEVTGKAVTLFWDMPVDDNAFLELKTGSGQVAWLHASCSEWKNLFSLEIYGRAGKLQIDGLGGSYGGERLIHYRMKPEMGPPETETREFPGPDLSWRREMEAFERDIATDTPPSPGLADALAALEIVDKVYRQNGTPRPD